MIDVYRDSTVTVLKEPVPRNELVDDHLIRRGYAWKNLKYEDRYDAPVGAVVDAEENQLEAAE